MHNRCYICNAFLTQIRQLLKSPLSIFPLIRRLQIKGLKPGIPTAGFHITTPPSSSGARFCTARRSTQVPGRLPRRTPLRFHSRTPLGALTGRATQSLRRTLSIFFSYMLFFLVCQKKTGYAHAPPEKLNNKSNTMNQECPRSHRSDAQRLAGT